MNKEVEIIYRISEKNLNEVLDTIKQYETYPNLKRITICVDDDSFKNDVKEMIERR